MAEDIALGNPVPALVSPQVVDGHEGERLEVHALNVNGIDANGGRLHGVGPAPEYDGVSSRKLANAAAASSARRRRERPLVAG